MSLALAQTRLIAATTAYKQALRNVTPVMPPDAGGTALPNNAARSSQSQRTRQRKFGDSRHSPAAMQSKTS